MALRFYSSVRLEVRKGQVIKQNGEMVGTKVRHVTCAAVGLTGVACCVGSCRLPTLPTMSHEVEKGIDFREPCILPRVFLGVVGRERPFAMHSFFLRFFSPGQQ